MLGKGHQLMSIHSQNRDLEEHTPSSLCYLPTLSGGCVSVAALKGKAFPHRSGSALLGQGRFPQRKCFTVFQKVSWQLGAKEYHKVTVHNKPHIQDLLGGKSSGGWLPQLGQKHQRTEQKTKFIKNFWECVCLGEMGGISSSGLGLLTLSCV